MQTFYVKNRNITSFDASTISNDFNVVNLSKCGKLKTIENLHLLSESVTGLDLSWCRSLGKLPQLPPQIKDLFLRNWRGLIKIEDPFSPNLTNIDLSGCLALKELPPFPPNLTCLNLSGCRSIESLQHPLPQSLTTINFASCKSLTTITHLHEGVTSLDLYNCSKLKIINFPDTLISLRLHHFNGSINSLPPLLESLIFSGHKCKKLPFILTDKITELDLDNCKNLEILPDDLPEGLKKLNLTKCRNLKSLPDSLSRLDNLKILKLKYCPLTELPSLPEALEELDLSGCESLTKLPKPLPRNLKILNLSQCKFLTELPDPLPEGLEELDLSDCKSLTKLPKPLPRNLKILNLFNCESLTELPDPLPENLKILNLFKCESLTELPDPLPEGLEQLYLSGCKSLTELPDPLPENLKKLNLSYCESLTELPDPLPKGLEELDFSGCKSLTKLPDPLPEGLIELTLFNCQKLEFLPESISKLRKLKIINFQNCKSLKEFPVNYHFPNNLKKLNLSYCESLTELPDPLPKGLEELNLSNCKSLTKLPKPLPRNLKILNLSGCRSLTELPDTLPEGLEKLYLSGCKSLTKLPDPLPENLKKLNLSYCESLTELPDPLPKELEELDLSGCKSLTKLPDPLPENLKKLDLSYCENLTHLPESLLDLDKLEILDVSHCDNLSEENINLLVKLEAKHHQAGNVQFRIFWPTHFVHPLISSCYDLLDQAYSEVNKGNGDAPIYSDKSTLQLFKRFTSENIFQRGGIEEIYDHANKVAKAIKDHPYLLDVLENNSIHYLTECVNQPVMGFVKTAILTDFAVEQDISAKLNIAKRMAIIATIEQEILILKSRSGDAVGEGVQIELGNAMLREIYNQNKDKIEEQTGGKWKGISKGITYEQTIRGFLTEENKAKVWQKVDNTLKYLSDIGKTREYVVEASLNGTHKEFAMIILGEEGFDERQKELKTLKEQHSEIKDPSSSSASEVFDRIKAIERGGNIKDKVVNKIRELSRESGEDRTKRQRIEGPGTSPGGSSILESEMRLR